MTEGTKRPPHGELLVVVGPTASGKTDLAIAMAERIGGEIVSADSVQVYRHFELGTGKPSVDELARARHHLVDCTEPDDPFDAGRFVREADRAIANIRSRERVPIVCGGTFLWIKALWQGLVKSAPADEAIRQSHRNLVAERGKQHLHNQLARVDASGAARLHPNDVLRVSRALEVFELTGRPQSEWHAEHQFSETRYKARLVGVAHERTTLDARIKARVDAWLEAGWVEEVEALLPKYATTRAMAAVGFRQIAQHLSGELPAEDLAAAIVRATRTFVRRQRTWLRDVDVEWVDHGGASAWLEQFEP